ncbi:MAG: signal recognition particle protein [Holosporales bacterium]|jgi:signal recognition particle subunit SRP54|nr:signal recognition particle protein [Holosporales bacterium]
MLENISKRFSEIFGGLRRTGILRLEDIDNALREIRISFLEADVSLPIVKEFINSVKEQALNQQITKSITPDQMIIKIVSDRLTALLSENKRDAFGKSPPKRVMLMGLQGAGKTTVAAKLANMFRQKCMTATCDIYRPAAAEQLRILSEQAGAKFFDSRTRDNAVESAKEALAAIKVSDCRTLILDTAGRLHTDDDMMRELIAVKEAVDPDEILLVVDSMTGQDAVKIAQQFISFVKPTGVVMTRMDSDARGGAVISIGKITGSPVVLLGTGERLDDIEPFDPSKLVKRILALRDISSLVEKVEKVTNQDEAKNSLNRLMQGKFDLNDLAKQIQALNKIGGIRSVLSMLPGVGSLVDKSPVGDESAIKRQLAIIRSMTKQEKRDYKIIKGSRKKRIAAGSGASVQDVNRLLKNFESMLDLMRRFKGNHASLDQIKQMLVGKVP